MRKEDDIIDIFVALIVGTVGSIIATYLVRLIDKLIHKNDRHSPKHGHFCVKYFIFIFSHF